jgi:hypothetical protein
MAQVGTGLNETSRFHVFGQMNHSVHIGNRLASSMLGNSDIMPLSLFKDEDYDCE